MTDLPSADHNELINWEIYDRSRHPDDGLIWLSSEEEAPRLVQTPESLVDMFLGVGGPEAIALERPAENLSVNLVSTDQPSSDIDVRFLPGNSSDGDGSVGILFGSSLASHKTFGQFNLTRRLFRVSALVAVLLIGSVLPSILGHLRTTRVKASPAVTAPSSATQSAGRSSSPHVRVLTVMAGQQETVKDISLRYVGRFDNDLFEEIRKLNADLKDPDHLEDGQLIRIPLRATAPAN
jgi:hypothetical protein